MNNKKYTQLKEKENEQIWNVKGIYLENTDSSSRERTEMALTSSMHTGRRELENTRSDSVAHTYIDIILEVLGAKVVILTPLGYLSAFLFNMSILDIYTPN